MRGYVANLLNFPVWVGGVVGQGGRGRRRAAGRESAGGKALHAASLGPVGNEATPGPSPVLPSGQTPEADGLGAPGEYQRAAGQTQVRKARGTGRLVFCPLNI